MPDFEPISFLTPAKINFYLLIQSKRQDGYHELVMDLIPVSVFDRIRLSPSDSGRVELRTNLPGVNQEDNLIIKAIRLLEKEAGKKFSLSIELDKKIPWGAGLGGGSGNAAGTLVMANRLLRLNIPDDRLSLLALSLGADVPFFLNPRPSLAEGIGERLTVLQRFDPINLLLVYPGFPVSTKLAYSICNKSKRQRLLHHYSLDEFRSLTPDNNDFWYPLVERYPQLKVTRETILKQGALFSGLSGSGSTLFGVFPDEETRNKAYSNLFEKNDWKVFKCETLPEYKYE
ncbi:4-(cytidine 5'-diphospho)-2-C-methyl-D-erythritol kinase [bacterium]|nr:4-(cytidine 5'-diphospho)-2-C-methyl-D-erythritol kinase [bacterium]